MPVENPLQTERRALIVDLLQDRPARTQADIADALRARGHDVTQSSVSRDLRELRVIKDASGYRLPDNDSQRSSELESAAEFIRSIATAGANLVVVKTAIGAAQRVALEIDRADWPEVVGTLSGDDTLFIATGGTTASRQLISRLEPKSQR
ncbi:MAG: ArgR family transcriptional regulator [Pseudomonadota bacterium]